MTIYVDDGERVKIYPVKAKVAKAVMTLLEMDEELVWSTTHAGYGVTIVNKGGSMKFLIKWLCFFYFYFHKNTTGLLFHDENFGSLRIKFEP